MKIDYSREEKPLGTAGPLSLIKDLEEDFFVLNGDVLTTLSFRDLMDYHKKKGAIATIAMHKKKVKLELGVMHTDGNHQVTGYVEKPLLSYQVSMGVYVFNRAVIDYIPPGIHMDFPDLILKLLKDHRKVISFPSEDYWLDIGTHFEYERALEEYDGIKDDIFR